MWTPIFRNRFMKEKQLHLPALAQDMQFRIQQKKTAKKNGIAVALLRKPVIWDGFEVNIVLIVCLHKSFDQVPKLYDLILNVFDDPVRFAQVLECDSYAAFMKKIHIT